MSTPTFSGGPRIYDDVAAGRPFNPADLLVQIGWQTLEAVKARRINWTPGVRARAFWFRVGSNPRTLILVAYAIDGTYAVEAGRGAVDAAGEAQWASLGLYRGIPGAGLSAVIEHAVTHDIGERIE